MKCKFSEIDMAADRIRRKITNSGSIGSANNSKFRLFIDVREHAVFLVFNIFV